MTAVTSPVTPHHFPTTSVEPEQPSRGIISSTWHAIQRVDQAISGGLITKVAIAALAFLSIRAITSYGNHLMHKMKVLFDFNHGHSYLNDIAIWLQNPMYQLVMRNINAFDSLNWKSNERIELFAKALVAIPCYGIVAIPGFFLGRTIELLTSSKINWNNLNKRETLEPRPGRDVVGYPIGEIRDFARQIEPGNNGRLAWLLDQESITSDKRRLHALGKCLESMIELNRQGHFNLYELAAERLEGLVREEATTLWSRSSTPNRRLADSFDQQLGDLFNLLTTQNYNQLLQEVHSPRDVELADFNPAGLRNLTRVDPSYSAASGDIYAYMCGIAAELKKPIRNASGEIDQAAMRRRHERIATKLAEHGTACAPTWVEGARAVYKELRGFSDGEQKILRDVGLYKEELLREYVTVDRQDSHWHNMQSFIEAFGDEIGLDDSTARQDPYRTQNVSKQPYKYIFMHKFRDVNRLVRGVQAAMEGNNDIYDPDIYEFAVRRTQEKFGLEREAARNFVREKMMDFDEELCVDKFNSRGVNFLLKAAGVLTT